MAMTIEERRASQREWARAKRATPEGRAASRAAVRAYQATPRGQQAKREAKCRFVDAHREAINEQSRKYRANTLWPRVNERADAIVVIFDLLPTDEARREEARWLLDAAQWGDNVTSLAITTRRVDNLLADYTAY